MKWIETTTGDLIRSDTIIRIFTEENLLYVVTTELMTAPIIETYLWGEKEHGYSPPFNRVHVIGNINKFLFLEDL